VGLSLIAIGASRVPLDAQDPLTWLGGVFLIGFTLMGVALSSNLRAARKAGAMALRASSPSWRWLDAYFVFLFLLLITSAILAKPTVLSLGGLLMCTQWMAQRFLGGARLGEYGVGYYSFSPWEEIVSWRLTEFLRRVEIQLRLRGDSPRLMVFQVARDAREPVERLLLDKLGQPDSYSAETAPPSAS
jgi:hypothetical protein